MKLHIQAQVLRIKYKDLRAMLQINLRRKVLFFLLFLNLCFLGGAQNWAPWAGVLTILFAVIVVDYLFLDDSQFDFDPNYKNWARRQDARR